MLFERMMRAARLDVNLYEEVEADQTATSQAATVVGIVAACSAVGAAVAATRVEGGGTGSAVLAVVLAIVGAFLGWILWSYITYWIGTSIFKGTATPGEMLRTIGFAQSPGVLNILSFIPVVGSIVSLVVGIWSLVAGVIALRQALDISTGQAVITAIIGFIPMMLVYCLIGVVVGGGAALTGAV